MRLKGKFRSHWYPLPEGYDLRKDPENQSGYVVCNRKIKRYLWNPERNCVFYEPTTKTIYKYMEWQGTAPSGLVGIDGFAKIKKLNGSKSMWVNNITVRECIPIKRKEITLEK